MVLGYLDRYEQRHRELLARDPTGRLDLLLARGAAERGGDHGRHADDDGAHARAGIGGLPPAFGSNGVIQGFPSTRRCLSKRHFIIHIRRYRGITYVEAIVFLNHHTVGVRKSNQGQFSAPINLRGLPAGNLPGEDHRDHDDRRDHLRDAYLPHVPQETRALRRASPSLTRVGRCGSHAEGP